MTKRKLKTLEDVRAAMQRFVDENSITEQDGTPIVVTEREVFRFVALEEAYSIGEMSCRELADLLEKGCEPIGRKNVESWCEWNADWADELDEKFADYFGVM